MAPVRPRPKEKLRPPIAEAPPATDKEPKPAPEAARAAPVVTAPEPAKPPEAAAPGGASGATGGSGTVAAGGTAAVAPAGARAGGVPGGTGTGVTLLRPPALLDPEACQDYYPSSADDDAGIVEVAADVSADGRATDVQIVREQPVRQGFGEAVRRCFLAIRFAPALDAAGRVTRARVRLNFRFVR